MANRDLETAPSTSRLRTLVLKLPSGTGRSTSLRVAEPVSVRKGPVFHMSPPPYRVRVPFQKSPTCRDALPDRVRL